MWDFKKQAVLTLSQWMPQPKDQNDNVSLLVNKMKDSLQTSQPDDAVKAMAIQVNISPCLNLEEKWNFKYFCHRGHH